METTVGIIGVIVAVFVIALVAGYRDAQNEREKQDAIWKEISNSFGDDSADEPLKGGYESDEDVNAEARPTETPDGRVGAMTEQRPASMDRAEREHAEFMNLWEQTQKRMGAYHRLAVIEGRQSFRSLLLFSGLGFGLLGFVVWRATFVEDPAGGIALGAASAAGAALTAYISGTFMRTYDDANDRLVNYFTEPLALSRLLAAERLLLTVNATKRDEAAMLIIRSALAGDVTSTTGSPTRRRSRKKKKDTDTPVGVNDQASGPSPTAAANESVGG